MMIARTCLNVWLVLFARVLLKTSSTVIEAPYRGDDSSLVVDCREVSGYSSDPAPDTCTIQLALNDSEVEIINSLREEYQYFPVKCRFGKQ